MSSGAPIPGTIVPTGAFASPGGAQGLGGQNASTLTNVGFTVPPVGQTVVVTVTDASWIVVGSIVYVDQAGGGIGAAGALQVTAKAGNQITLLTPQPPPTLPLADTNQSGLLKQVSGNTTDFVDGTNKCQSLKNAVQSVTPPADATQPGLLDTLSGTATDFVGGDNNCHPMPIASTSVSGDLNPLSGKATDFVGGDNKCHSMPIASASVSGDLNPLSGNATDYVGGDNACHNLITTTPILGGVLRYVSATQLSFLPFNGNYIRINGLWYPIPVGGIAGLANTGVYVNGVAGQSLANTTLYRVYCFNNAGTLTADFSTTGHATSTTSGNVGTEIKSGDDTRTLIGLILTSGTGTFYDTPQFRYTRSWLNGGRVSFFYSASVVINSTTVTQTAAAAVVVCFANEALFASATWYGTATASTNVNFQMCLDGVVAGISAATTTGTTAKYENGAVVGSWVASEGQRSVALFASVSAANTATGSGAIAGITG